MLRLVTFKLEEELLEKLDREAERLGMSRSDVIRTIIQRYFKEKEQPLKTNVTVIKVID